MYLNWENRSGLLMWRGQGGLLGALAVMILLASPQPVAACSFYNPICWVEEGVDFFEDLMEDAADLAWDVLTLDLEGAYHDFIDIVENLFCEMQSPLGVPVTLLNFIGAGVAEDMYNNSCAAPHTIAPEVLEKLRPYFKSSFTTVVIHEDCDFSNRNAITFGEHIYFGRPDPAKGIRGYRPMGASGKVDAAGFADLAHELIHVLQYRREGFADFICLYWQECGIAAEFSGGESGVSCGFEQQAYMFEALVYEDVKRDGDGIFTCALDSHEWNADNVHLHSCVDKKPLDNCPDNFNPDQANSDGDGLGDACDSYPYTSGNGGDDGGNNFSCVYPPPEITCPDGQQWLPQSCTCGCDPGLNRSCSSYWIGAYWDEATCSCKE